jgi:acetyl-CoA carboxylase carboxyltransferase component
VTGKVAVTALARIGGRTVGIVANNPLVKGGALDTDACDKITSFIVLCDSFNIPLVILVDTPGFAIGTEPERRRAPGKIMNFMNALGLTTVPKLSLVLRKSYGGAYIVMDSKRMGNDVCLAWPGAELAVMGAGQAAAILMRRSSPEQWPRDVDA